MPESSPSEPPPSSGAAVSRGLRDRHGRGVRHPLPLGARAKRSRPPVIVRAVRGAVDRLGALGRPELDGTVVRVQRIPDSPDRLLARFRAGDRPAPWELGARGRLEADGRLTVTVHERALTESVDRADLTEAVYAAVLAACAEALGVTVQALDPSWPDPDG